MDLRLPDGRWLRTNNDGSQDEGDRANDDVLLEFFAPVRRRCRRQTAAQTRLIAINDGRLVDFLTAHGEPVRGARAHWFARASRASRPGGDIAVVNLNQRSLVAR